MKYKEDPIPTRILYDDPSDNYILITKATYDTFFKEENSGDLIAVYSFYCYIAKWQHTNQVKATNGYCMKGLKFGETRFMRAKKKLVELGLIENIKQGRGGGWYIRIRFIATKQTINKELGKQGSYKNLENQDLGKQGTNALSYNNINALSYNTPKKLKRKRKLPKVKTAIQIKNELYLPLATKLSDIITSNKNIEHTPPQLKGWSNDIRILNITNKISIDRIKAALKWYKTNIGGQYVPVIESGSSFRNKFIKLESAIERDKNPFPNNNNVPTNGSRHYGSDKTDYSGIEVTDFHSNKKLNKS